MIGLRAPFSSRWLAASFWPALVIATYFAFAPKSAQPSVEVSDVLTHGFAFVYLTLALSAAHYRSGRSWAPAAWMAGYGVLIEMVQLFLPDRAFELKDLLVDAAGIAIGTTLYRWHGARWVERLFS